jgi:hypothetical protein
MYTITLHENKLRDQTTVDVKLLYYYHMISYTNSECIVLSMIHHKIIYSKSWFDLPWSKIYNDYRNKFELREFKNKIK